MDSVRLYEHSISMLPHEIWAKIFEYLPADSRISTMWSLVCRYPSFAFVIMHSPHLWMDWIFESGGRVKQPIATVFAISLWRKLHRGGRSIPITVHAMQTAVRTSALAYYLPSESLPFIRSIYIRLRRGLFLNCDLRVFLDGLPNTTSLALSVCDNHSDFDLTPVPCMTATMGHPLATTMSSLSSLTLSGICFDKPTIARTHFGALTSLRLYDIRFWPTMEAPSLFDILLSTPVLRELAVRVHWSRPRSQRLLFGLPSGTSSTGLVSQLRAVDIEGERGCTVPFLKTLLGGLDTSLLHLRVVFFCYARHRCDMFQEFPSVIREIAERCTALSVDVDCHSFLARWNTASGVFYERSIEWRLYDLWADYWVSVPAHEFVFYLIRGGSLERCAPRF